MARTKRLIPFAVYAAAAVAIVAIPPARTLHAESAALVAATACFTTGLWTISLLRRNKATLTNLGLLVVAPAVALLALTLSTILHPGCWSADGLLLFVAFVPTACLFGGSAAYLAWTIAPQRAVLTFSSGIVLSALLSVVFDLGLHPQMYSYSHVFGGFLGPVYDAELAVRSGVFTFRSLTVLWCAFFVAVGRIRIDGWSWRRSVFAISVLVGLLCCYTFRVQLGFNTSAEAIKQALGGHVQTEHFDLWYAAGDVLLSDSTISAIVEGQEEEFDRLASALNVQPRTRVQVFVYGSPQQRANLTGVRNTSVAPVWLSDPQVHLLASRHEESFPHELVHIFAREFGSPPLNASWKLGLVEGIAVALGGVEPSTDVDDVVRLAAVEFGLPPDALAATLRSFLRPDGFWTARGPVAYSASGSFVSYLLRHYDIESFKRVYGGASFRSVYGLDVQALADEWAAAVLSEPVAADSARQQAILAALNRPSMFEGACPHVR